MIHVDPAAELAWCHRRLAEIRQKYTKPDEQQYLALLIQAWQYRIRTLEAEAHAIQSQSKP